MFLQLCIFFLCIIYGALALPQSQADDYSHHSVLDADGHFQLYWSFDNHTITMQYHAMSKGWAGLGFSPNGAMTGADIAVFWIDGSGKGYVSDRHADHNGFPPEDKHQDYNLIDAKKNDTHIIVKFSRKRNTCDKEDWALTEDTTRVIYAANDKVPESKDSFEKHTTRGVRSIHFFNERPDTPDGVPPEANSTALEIRVSNVSVPENRDTLYWCEFIKMPQIPTKKHIIKMEPVIQHENVDVVHHLLVYTCGTLNVSKFVGAGAPCFDTQNEFTKAVGKCSTTVLTAWAVGGQSVIYPDNIGLPIQNPNDDMYVMIQMHYDNSQFKKGKVDSSGMRLWLTDNLRPIDAGQTSFGLDVPNQILPPGVKNATSYGYCSAKCTKELPSDGIKILGGFLHSHLAGRKIRLLHYRSGVQLPDILSDEYYDFNYQDYQRLTNPVTVLPGDELVVECTYDTSDRNTTTFGGISTHDEMCLVYADYYPSAYDGFICVSGASPSDGSTILSALDRYDNGTIKGCNETLYDCIKDYQWSQTEKDRILDVQRNGLHNAICLKDIINATNGNIETFIEVYKEKGYPNVTKPYVIPDVCASGASSYAVSFILFQVFAALTYLFA